MIQCLSTFLMEALLPNFVSMCRVARIEASQQAVPASVKALAAGFAAALLVSSSPAHAGVKFEKVVSKKVCHPHHKHGTH